MKLSGSTVLLVDDDSMIRELLKEFFEEREAVVVEAADGIFAVRALRERPEIKLMITDIVMPESDGIELILSARKNHPNVKVVAISGGGSLLDSNASLHDAALLGAHRVVQKPFSLGQLDSLIADL